MKAAAERVADARLALLDVDPVAWRRRVIFDCCKWDPQVGDTATISDHACVLSEAAASELARMAEALAAETVELERALQGRPDMFRELGIEKRLRGPLARAKLDGPQVRVMRFDFHPTAEGWALSEVNADVPGGFAEASALPALAADHVTGTVSSGDVAAALVRAVRTKTDGRVAFVHATSYSDDRQVMRFLARRFEEAGFTTLLAAPDHLKWSEGRAASIVGGAAGPVDAIVRFFPAEWMPELPKRSAWETYFTSQTLSCNPAHALLGQSKRLPLVWDRLGVDAPAWRRALPETRDPREAKWETDDSWLLKPAFGRVGEGVAWVGGGDKKLWRTIARTAKRWPRDWLAQKRFTPRALESRDGPRHLCVGVFTVDGKAAGFYGRLSARSVIEKHAQDVAVLVAAPQGERHAA